MSTITFMDMPKNTPKIAWKYIAQIQEQNEELKKENKQIKEVLRFHEKAESMDYLRQLTLKHLKNVVEDLKEENKKLKEDLKLYGFYY